MSSEERRARERLAIQDRILNAARELFVRNGYESVSLRKIAEAIDYTAPALYTHFKDKEELLRELCRRDFGALSQTFYRLMDIPDPLERIAATGRAYVRFALDHPNHYRLMFMIPKVSELKLTAEDERKRGNPELDGYAFLRMAVREAQAAGRWRPELTDADLVTQVLWSGLHGVASLEITHAKDEWVELRSLAQRTDLMIVALIRGLLARPESWPTEATR